MREVGHLTVFLSHLIQNCHLVATSCYRHVHMLPPCSYAFVSTLFLRQEVKTPFGMHHFEGSFKNSSTWPCPPAIPILHITHSVLAQPILPPRTSFYSGEHCSYALLVQYRQMESCGPSLVINLHFTAVQFHSVCAGVDHSL